MASNRKSNGSIVPAPGIRDAVQAKARKRRSTNTAVTALFQGAPPPRNDLLPSLYIENVAIDSVRPARRDGTLPVATLMHDAVGAMKGITVCEI